MCSCSQDPRGAARVGEGGLRAGPTAWCRGTSQRRAQPMPWVAEPRALCRVSRGSLNSSVRLEGFVTSSAAV